MSSRRRLAVCAFALAMTIATPPRASENYEPMLLASKLGEMCSQCVAALACLPSTGGETPATIYLFPVKTVWQQIMTIPTYLPFVGKPEIDRRPVIVHGPATQETGVTGDAGLAFAAAELRVPGAIIDRKTGVWTSGSGAPLGRCLPAGRTLSEARAALAEAVRP